MAIDLEKENFELKADILRIKLTLSGILLVRRDIYIYIYIYIVFFGPVKPELGVIPSGQKIIPEWIFKFSW